jgi:predicted nucleotidyltransferase
MKLSEQQKHIIQDYFKDKPVLKAYVFGSYARGDADEKSDIDLLIEIAYENMKGGLWYFGVSDDLKEVLSIDVDVISENSISPYIRDFIERDKTLIYERAIS